MDGSWGELRGRQIQLHERNGEGHDVDKLDELEETVDALREASAVRKSG